MMNRNLPGINPRSRHRFGCPPSFLPLLDKTMQNLVDANNPTELASLIDAIRGLATKSGLSSERALANRLNVKRHQLRRALHALRESEQIGPPEPNPRGGGVRNRTAQIQRTH